MNIKKLKPIIFLRLGLGLMYLYSGSDFIFFPQHWYGFVPGWLTRALLPYFSTDTYLAIQGGGEIILGLIFLGWFLPNWLAGLAGLLGSIEMALILIFIGIDPITFRDIGLLGASLAIFWGEFKNK